MAEPVKAVVAVLAAAAERSLAGAFRGHLEG
jgi:hypothetical protein